jgi:hypothetical protein
MPDGPDEFCENEDNTTYTASGSSLALTYDWVLEPESAGTVVNDGAQTVSVNWSDTFDGAAALKVKALNGCGESNFSPSLAITVLPNPAIFSVTGGGMFCTGSEGVEVGLNGSESDVKYRLFKNGSQTNTILDGTGSPLNFGMIDEEGYYTVKAISNATSCAVFMQNTANVNEIDLPASFTITGGGVYCEGGTGFDIGLDGSESLVSYELLLNNEPIGNILTGNGQPLNFGIQSEEGSYSVLATRINFPCTNLMNGPVEIVILPLPAPYTITGGGSFCEGGEGVEVGLSNSDVGVEYELYYLDQQTGVVVQGTGSPISFGLVDEEGEYTAVGANIVTECNNPMNSSVSVTMVPLPTVYEITGGGAYCEGTSGSVIGLDGSELNCTYELFCNNVTTGVNLPGTGNPISFGTFTAPGNYHITATESQLSCFSIMDGTTDISIAYLPLIPAAPEGPVYVDLFYTNVSEYTTSGSDHSTSYQWVIDPNDAGTIDITGLTTCEATWNMDFLGEAELRVQGVNTCGESEWSEALVVTVDNTVGFSSPANHDQLRISPNPSDGIFTIQMKIEQEGTASIKVVSSVNSVVFEERNLRITGDFTKTIDLGDLPDGIYFLSVETGTSTFIRKLILN